MRRDADVQDAPPVVAKDDEAIEQLEGQRGQSEEVAGRCDAEVVDARPRRLAVAWQGTIFSVQPRIRLTRYHDQRSHSYLGSRSGWRGG